MSKLFSKDDFRDNCGFGLIAHINGIKSHKIINQSINALRSMTHRGAIGADGKTGDGCGHTVTTYGISRRRAGPRGGQRATVALCCAVQGFRRRRRPHLRGVPGGGA